MSTAREATLTFLDLAIQQLAVCLPNKSLIYLLAGPRFIGKILLNHY
jgi:hypothetical protein